MMIKFEDILKEFMMAHPAQSYIANSLNMALTQSTPSDTAQQYMHNMTHGNCYGADEDDYSDEDFDADDEEIDFEVDK